MSTYVHDVGQNTKEGNKKLFAEQYTLSVGEQADSFWLEKAKQHLSWFKEPTEGLRGGFEDEKKRITWFRDGTLNASHICLDRHLEERADQTAIIWEPSDPKVEARHISYAELHELTGKFANVLKSYGVKQGDRVAIYMPMIPEAAVAMLACARIGAIHTVVFGGLSSKQLRDRILDTKCDVVITADGSNHGSKMVHLKETVEVALTECPDVHRVITIKHTGIPINWVPGRDVWYHEAMEKEDSNCPLAEIDAEHPLFILYTSGSTGKPKGVLHATAGYLLQSAMTFRDSFDYRDGEVHWCTADVGWITGHSYLVYGPLANGATTVMFEGIPTYPDVSRFWEVIDKHQVNIFYTAPTAIRALMGHGDEPVHKTSRASLRVLGTVGEPINPEAYKWYEEVVGRGKCPVVDTYWQTETGAHVIMTLPGVEEAVPGVAGRPYLGVSLALLDVDGNEVVGEGKGNLVITKPWPGMMRSVYHDHGRMLETYFSQYPGYFFTGDGAYRDSHGRYQITGRVDDVLNVSGHRLGSAEIESALVLHESVAEAAVVGYPHPVTGEGIFAYVTLMKGVSEDDTLKAELIEHVRKEIGPIAKIGRMLFASSLPKTRSGKIMRRLLRKIAVGNTDEKDMGDISTLADPSVIQSLIEKRAA